MRRIGAPSEIGRLAAPLARVLDGAWQRMHWWIVTMAVLYALSGITVVRPDEVAVVLRWGRLVGATSALQQHGPGLLFAFPRPVDQVVRVPVKHVWEVEVNTLNVASSPPPIDREEGAGDPTLNPVTQGYAITADHNIVHVAMVARYRVRDPPEWAFYGMNAEDMLRAEVTAAMVRSLGEMSVDRVLADGRKDLIAATASRAQAGLDASHSGLELSSLELTRLAPPDELAREFDNVQSAFIGAETRKKEAEAFRETAIPGAQAAAEAALQAARGAADTAAAAATGDANAFLALDREYRASAVVVRERLYRNALEEALRKAGNVRWIPPPVGGAYHGLRITLAPNVAGAPLSAPSPAASPEDDDER